MSSFTSFGIITVVVSFKIFLCIPAYAADAAPINPNETKTHN